MLAGGVASGGRASWTSNAAELSASQPGASSSREGRPTVVETACAVGARDAGAMYLRRGTGWYLTSVQVTLGVCE